MKDKLFMLIAERLFHDDLDENRENLWGWLCPHGLATPAWIGNQELSSERLLLHQSLLQEFEAVLQFRQVGMLRSRVALHCRRH
jgi:hypothetical protein